MWCKAFANSGFSIPKNLRVDVPEIIGKCPIYNLGDFLHHWGSKLVSTELICRDFPPRGARLLEPVSYLDMRILGKNAWAILADFGGVQKEAFFFCVPCVTLRNETEWRETVETGWNVLGGCDSRKIFEAPLSARFSEESVRPFLDMHAAEKIIGIVKELYANAVATR